jgi:hypothetical protein
MNALLRVLPAGVALWLFSPLAFAAVGISMSSLVDTVIYLLIIGIVVGILIFLVNRAPFIPAEWKQIIVYIIYFICAIAVINLLLGMTGHPLVEFR